MLMAKDLKEVTDNEYIQKIKPNKKETPSDFVEISPDDETVFDKAITAQLEYGKRVP